VAQHYIHAKHPFVQQFTLQHQQQQQPLSNVNAPDQIGPAEEKIEPDEEEIDATAAAAATGATNETTASVHTQKRTSVHGKGPIHQPSLKAATACKH
jgi:hypothetical protein